MLMTLLPKVILLLLLVDAAATEISSCVATWSQRQSKPLDVWVFVQETSVDNSVPPSPTRVSEKAMKRRALRGTDQGKDFLVSQVVLEKIAATGVQIRTTSSWLQAVSVTVNSKKQLDDLQELKFVTKLSCVVKHSPDKGKDHGGVKFADKRQEESQRNFYGATEEVLSTLSIPEVHKLGFTGKGVLIMVVDSGFSLDHISIPKAQILDQYDFVRGDNDTSGDGQQMKHGTSTLSLIIGRHEGSFVGAAYEANVILAKTEALEFEELVEEDYFVQALEWGEAQGVDLVSSSLGYNKFWDFGDYNGETSLASKAIDMAFRRGVVVVMSVGNYGERSLATPADAKGALAVGSVNVNVVRSYFSSVGPTADGRIKPDVVGPGERVPVANFLHKPNNTEGVAYTTNSGTSFSCPLVAGVVALVIQAHPDWSSGQVIEAVRRSASSSDSPNVEIGWGFVNALRAINYRPAGWLAPSNCSSFCSQGNCVGEVCVCDEGWYGYDCSFRSLACHEWCKSRCYESRCLCASIQKGRCYNDLIPGWECPIMHWNDTRICHFCVDGSPDGFQDPDCLGWTYEECGGRPSIPVTDLSTHCNKTFPDDLPKAPEPQEKPKLVPTPSEPPQFLSSQAPDSTEPSKTGLTPGEGGVGSAIGFSALIGSTVLCCLALAIFLRSRARRLRKSTEAIAYEQQFV